jgi:Kef-type K+ transport system membrane component KefB
VARTKPHAAPIGFGRRPRDGTDGLGWQRGPVNRRPRNRHPGRRCRRGGVGPRRGDRWGARGEPEAFDGRTSAYVAIALTFSSTVIIVKLLSDKGEIGSLYGRIALGFLIVQDIVVVLAMVVLSTLGMGAAERIPPLGALAALSAALVLLAGIATFVRYVANPLVENLARSPELLVSFAIGWAAFLAALGDYLGFGKEIGVLLAGVSLASTPFREAMSTRLTSLRDFLLLFFFTGQ